MAFQEKIAELIPKETEQYKQSLKNVIDTSFEKGKMNGKIEKKMEIVLKALEKSTELGTVAELRGMVEIEIAKLKK